MPVLRCPECGSVVAWRGRRLSFDCPGEHPRRWDPPTLHVDRHLAHRNGDGIDAHLPDHGADARAADAERDLVAENLSKRP